ncbi:hypothetical protein DXG01_013901 [Tephrocybe rancida]|nr:hypothetical protein DXG01_013901 [Tephrocybe rancida]
MSSSTDAPHPSQTSPRGGPQPNDSPAGFSPGASPPLILAFLAIGLFALSMVGVFGWRRIQVARLELRGGTHEWNPDERLTGTVNGLGPRPLLWDLWTSDEKGQYNGEKEGRALPKNFYRMEEHETWDSIMPVAVTVTPPYPSGDDEVASPAPTPDAMRFYRWSRYSDPTAATTATANHTSITTGTDTKEKGTARTSGDSSSNDKRRLQVAVVIAMPSQRIPHDATGERTRTETEIGGETIIDDTFEYTLGVYDCTWRSNGG